MCYSPRICTRRRNTFKFYDNIVAIFAFVTKIEGCSWIARGKGGEGGKIGNRVKMIG